MRPSDAISLVYKFGGSSLADATRFERVAAIVAARAAPRIAVVVSAMSGVTDALMHAAERAGARDGGYRTQLGELRMRHVSAIESLVPDRSAALIADLDRDLVTLHEVLHAATLLGGASSDARDLVSGYGEVWSARMLAERLTAQGVSATWLDARETLTVTWNGVRPDVDWDASRTRLEAWLGSHDTPDVIVITGFIASTPNGVATTLGRNGSDFSASIFAALLEAGEIHIWTDVDGVMSADPRLVPEALTLSNLSYNEAMELAYFGARVIHPSTMAPAVARGLPIIIRNTFRPELPGTRIHFGSPSEFAVKGLATIESVAILNVEGTGLIGVPGTAERLFGALRDDGISVIMISQGSSEHSICFAVPGTLADRARAAVERAFFAERHHGQIQNVDVVNDCSILAVVGDGMAGKPGVAARFFSALGKANVNIRAIAQGSSERNISVVVDGADTRRALRAAHAGFYLSKQTLSIGLIGAGNVGRVLLGQIVSQEDTLRQRAKVDLRVRAIASSRRMLLAPRAIPLADWATTFERDAEPIDIPRLVDHVHTDQVPHAVIIDCTASDDIARHYGAWLERGIHVITPNKRANTAGFDYYRRLREANRAEGAHYLYETTVGAALPIIGTLRDLVQTGDEVMRIEGILSGTLSYLFNIYDGSRPFSMLVAEARALGYTEPDPRDDLSGMDVARKMVILAREMGLALELDDVEVEGLVPDTLREGDVDEFLARLPEHDARIAAMRQEAERDGAVLRYVGSVDRDGSARAGLQKYPVSHPFARIHRTDNIVLFRTGRYDEQPLIVQGPGAGREVTAAGVFSDLLRLASWLGAPL
jgi:aspartokinase/homoserine dehydrogenase 1